MLALLTLLVLLPRFYNKNSTEKKRIVGKKNDSSINILDDDQVQQQGEGMYAATVHYLAGAMHNTYGRP
jgi:hypothetical protein